MKKETSTKSIGQSFRHTLYWAVCILLALTVLTAWSVSGVYAKYVDSALAADSAGVAGMGISKFELLEHKANRIYDEKWEDGTLDGDTVYPGLYKLDPNETVLNNSYDTVIPGIDIAKDPFINLVLENNEVSYQLYVLVEKSADFPENIIVTLTKDWEKVESDNIPDGATLYKYKEVFAAGTPRNFTGENVIKILEGDKIRVSEHFNSEPDENGKATKFSLTFTARLEQTLTPASSSGSNSGSEGSDTP